MSGIYLRRRLIDAEEMAHFHVGYMAVACVLAVGYVHLLII